MLRLSIEPFTEKNRQVFYNLYPLYLYDLSPYVLPEDGGEPNPHGIFSGDAEMTTLQTQAETHDDWLTDKILQPQLLRVNNLPAGFALFAPREYARGADWYLSQFFLLRVYRGRGIAQKAALEIFRSHPGEWMFEVSAQNEPALRFWHRLLPHAYTSEENNSVFFKFDSGRV